MKLSKKIKVGYAFASLGDSASYNFIGTFLLFFLTTIANIDPALAGTITAVGACCDTICSPIVGYISDNSNYTGKSKIINKMGKRRPFLLLAAIPLGLMCCTLFTDVGLPGNLKTAYYLIMVMVFWVSFSTFFNPYLAMGAEITDDYNERTSLRSMAYIFNTLGMLIGMVLPNASVDMMKNLGFTDEKAWQFTGLMVGVLTAVSILITVFTTNSNNKEKTFDQTSDNAKASQKKPSLINMIKDYRELISLKPFWFLIGTGILFLIANSIGNSVRVYFFTYNLQCTPLQISFILLFAMLFGVVVAPIINYFGRKHDKRKAYIGSMTLSAILVFLTKFLGMHTLGAGIVFTLVYAIGVTAYWQLMPAMIYDICELDDLYNGKRREGGVSAVQCFAEAISGAIGFQILGLILKFSGFDGEAKIQTPTALSSIEISLTIVVSGLFLCSVVVMYFYPITKEKYNEIIKAIAKRKAGETLKKGDYPL